MKKLIAIAVVFALVMGGVFAETSVGGSTDIKVVLGKGETGKDSQTAGGANVRLQLTGQNEEGTFGAQFRFDSSIMWSGTTPINNVRSKVWWKPIDMLKIQLGSDLDGSFGIGDVNTGWGFYGNYADWGMWKPQRGGDGETFPAYRTGSGLFLSVTPITNLSVNMIIPYRNWDLLVMDVYQKIYGEVVYKIDNIGTVKAGYQSDTGALGTAPISQSALDAYALAQTQYDLGLISAEPKAPTAAFLDNPHKLGISFDMGDLLKPMGMSLAFKLHTGLPTANTQQNLSRTQPLYMNLGAGFSAGDFNVKFRFFGQFLGKTTNTATDVVTKDAAFIQLGLFPYYTVSGNLAVGMGFDVRVNDIGEKPNGDKLDTIIRWHTSPFVQYKVGAGKFQVGLNVGTNNDAAKPAESVLAWEIPIRMDYNF